MAAGSDAEWARVTEVLGRPDLLGDPRFAEAADRAAHDAELTAELADSLGKRSAADWESRFTAAGVAGVRAEASTPGPFFAHEPQVLANGFTPECSHARFGPYRRWGPVVRVNGGPPELGPGVLAGEQTDEILAALGRSPEAIAALRAAGVVASEPVEWG